MSFDNKQLLADFSVDDARRAFMTAQSEMARDLENWDTRNFEPWDAAAVEPADRKVFNALARAVGALQEAIHVFGYQSSEWLTLVHNLGVVAHEHGRPAPQTAHQQSLLDLIQMLDDLRRAAERSGGRGALPHVREHAWVSTAAHQWEAATKSEAWPEGVRASAGENSRFWRDLDGFQQSSEAAHWLPKVSRDLVVKALERRSETNSALGAGKTG